MNLPKALIDQIQGGNVVLFLGAGASYGALHPTPNTKIPLGSALSDMIATKFLGNDYINQPLSHISELAISQTSLFTVQQFLRDYFEKFEPTDFHKLIPQFNWKSIFTTNYDYIIEKAYANKNKALQDLSPVVKNTNQKEVMRTEKSLPYYKLHGCISNINDEGVPLILTPEQYVSHKKNRDRLFDRLQEMAYDYTFVFVGFSFADLDIRAAFQDISSSVDSKPRSYMIAPNADDISISMWETKKVTTLKMSFENFLYKLDEVISQNNRILGASKSEVEFPIYNKFVVNINDIRPTEGFSLFLERDIDYLHNAFSTEPTKPEAFYKGYFENWNPIAINLDVRRSITDGIIGEVFLDEDEVTLATKLFVIKGYAGSGKSVLLKRIAWDASTEFGQFCIFLKPGARLKYENFLELYNYVKSRIFLFVDGVSGQEEDLKNIISKCIKDKIPLSVICTERVNIWNTDCKYLEKFVTESYEVKSLNPKEVDLLISLLERHNALGTLKIKSEEDRKKLFSEFANNQLLVALYEATHGKPFEEIIFDEYNSISSESAKSLYLTVSILHRLGAAARAGLISRIHNISFTEFKDKFFKPLEFIVYDKQDYRINDFIYLTRHKQIADIVFERGLKDEQSRFDEYYRLLNNLNIDFDSDRLAYVAMINARKLQSVFNDPQNSRKLLDLAKKNNPEDAKVLQQRAILEMNNSGGSLYTAQKYLDLAKEKAPHDVVIAHSYAELAFQNAEVASTNLEKDRCINDSITICERLIKKKPETSHAYHTLIKCHIFRLKKTLLENDIPAIERELKEIEKCFAKAKQIFIDDEYISEVEASFNELMDKSNDAKLILRKAFEANKNSPFIAIRYAKILEQNNEQDNALVVITEALKASPNDRDLHFTKGKMLSNFPEENILEILHHLRKSFTANDSRHDAQFLYARALYLNNQINDAKNIFNELSQIPIAPSIKRQPRGFLKKNGKKLKFSGTIKKNELSHGFLTRDIFGDSLYFDKYNMQIEISYGDRVSFNVAFTYRGPIAIELTKI